MLPNPPVMCILLSVAGDLLVVLFAKVAFTTANHEYSRKQA